MPTEENTDLPLKAILDKIGFYREGEVNVVSLPLWMSPVLIDDISGLKSRLMDGYIKTRVVGFRTLKSFPKVVQSHIFLNLSLPANAKMKLCYVVVHDNRFYIII